MKRWISLLVSMAVIVFGIGLFLYPDFCTIQLEMNTQRAISRFEKAYGISAEHEELDGIQKQVNTSGAERQGQSGDGSLSDPLYRDIVSYNTAIYANGQRDLSKMSDYEQPAVDIAEFPDEVFGFIEIPAMDVKLSLYIGASEENMAKGAAVMGQTSLPVGGENTNSVIVGHRGYRGAPYFREIEKLEIGDELYITNPWETLTYRVTSIDIVQPYDRDGILIQEGRDMITLVTCHPYRSGGKYRYLVYCDRADEADEATPAYEKERHKGYIQASDGRVYPSSAGDIRMELLFRRISGVLIVLMVLFTVWKSRRRFMFPADLQKTPLTRGRRKHTG